jgi:DNA-binding Xre family transcriptional regulator
MRRKKTTKSKSRSTQQLERERKLREKYQRERPSLSSLVKTGDYYPPVSQAEVLALMKFAARIKERRQQLHLSLAELAARTGIDKAALSRLENGQAENPTYSTLNRVAKALQKRLRLVLEDNRPHRSS